MIYEPNTIEWPVGALVIHDADAKRTDMLMRVTGRDKTTGEYTTCYAYPAEQPKQWPRKFTLHETKDGPVMAILEVEREAVPLFTARTV